MKRITILKSRLLIVVILAVLIGAVVAVQATTANSFATSSDVIRQPRPHPQSHIKQIAEPGYTSLYPRPHPKSHIEMLVDRP